MRLRFSRSIAPALLLATSSAFAAHPPVHRGPTPPHTPHPHVAAKPAGIEPERATQIQTALIKAGYLTGEPSGTWDEPTQAAMEKMQSDNGWQTKLVPDSRAIIKLGLGPQASATTAAQAEPGGEPAESAASSAASN